MHRNYAVVTSLALAASLFAIPGKAGPSFDCARAKAPAERAICANPKASILDSELASAYRDALSRLADDPEAASRLRSDQKSFVAYRDRLVGNENFELVDYLARRRDFLRSIDGTARSGVEGRWRSFWGEARIRRSDTGVFHVASWMAEPVVASWSCGDPTEESAGRLEDDVLATGGKDGGPRYRRRGRLLVIDLDAATADVCRGLVPDALEMFPVSHAQPRADLPTSPDPKRGVRSGTDRRDDRRLSELIGQATLIAGAMGRQRKRIS